MMDIRRAALLASATVLSLVLAEASLRWLDRRPPDEKVLYLTAYDPELGWSKEPNRTVHHRTREFQVVESTNEQGLRGPSIPFEKPPDVCRVLLLGDSFLEGYTVSFEDLVSERLRRKLQERDTSRVEVVNGGTVGYATDQELLFYRRDGRRYRPDATVLLFYVNDVWFNASERYWRGSKPRFVLENGEIELVNHPVPPPDPEQFAYAVSGGRGFTRFVRQADAWMGARSAFYRLARASVTDSDLARRWLIRAGFADVPGEWKPWKKRPSPDIEEAWSVTEALLVRLRDEVEADGSSFTIFHVPSRAAVDAESWRQLRYAYAMTDEDWDPSHDAKRLDEICSEHEIDCIIALDEFRDEAKGGPLYFREDAHWTPAGHDLAARLIADRLLSR